MARKYWLTVHWPRRVEENDYDNCVYLQECFVERGVGACMSPGDMVAVYEYSGVPTPPEIDDNGQLVQRAPGAQGIIWYGRVVEPCPDRTPFQVNHEGDVVRAWICWREVKIVNRNGLVRRQVLNPILQYADGYNFHGFAGGAGLKKITREEFEAIRAAFRQ